MRRSVVTGKATTAEAACASLIKKEEEIMKRLVFRPVALMFAFMAMAMSACGQSDGTNDKKEMENSMIRLSIEGGRSFTATLADNSSARALKELLAKGDITIHMEDYANMEKVGSLGRSLPRNDRPTTTSAGDLILYQGHNLVIYYDTNSWNFTRLGRIEGVTGEELLAALGRGDVTVTLSAVADNE